MKRIENLCMKCMSDKGGLKRCPFCGYVGDEAQLGGAFEKNLILQDNYVMGNKVRENAESVCYIGYDMKNKSKVHIREFFPAEICNRGADGLSVVAKESCGERYEDLKISFLQYFRSLAKVRYIDAVCSVYDIFADYGTAYVISEMVDGITLSELVRRNKKPLEWDTAKVLFMPLISAFSRLSKAGILHLAVSPDALIISRAGKMYISDFSTPNARQIGTFFDFDFNKGYTAPEQYIKGYKLTQAADVYGLAASLFFALVGFAPKDASAREIDDRLLIPVKLLKNIPPHVVSALSHALRVNAQSRTQTFEIFRDELTETSAKYLKEQEMIVSESQENSRISKSDKRKNFAWILSTAGVALTALTLLAAFFAYNNANKKVEPSAESPLVSEATNTQENITVPDFIGMDADKLVQSSEMSDYNIFFAEKVFDDKIAEGKVISQTPVPGSSVKKGSNIVITVSKGPKFRALPQIEGLTLSQASAVLTKEGFTPASEFCYSSSIVHGKTIGYKGCSKGDKLEFGARVTILVSKGKR